MSLPHAWHQQGITLLFQLLVATTIGPSPNLVLPLGVICSYYLLLFIAHAGVPLCTLLHCAFVLHSCQ